MALTISEDRYQDIRRRLAEAKLQKLIAGPQPGDISFSSVDALFEHLDKLVEQTEVHLPGMRMKE